MNAFSDNVLKILANQEVHMNEHLLDPIDIPNDKPLYPDVQTCKSCNYKFLSNKKKVKYNGHDIVDRCHVWNNMIIKNEIKCEFYSPIMVSGLQQLMFKMIRLAYPSTIVAKEFKEYSL